MAQQIRRTGRAVQDRPGEVDAAREVATDGGIEIQDTIECPGCGEVGAYLTTKHKGSNGELFIRRYCPDCEKVYDASMEFNGGFNADGRDDPGAGHSRRGSE